MKFIEFIGMYPRRIENDFKEQIKVLKNELEEHERTIIFQISNRMDNVDLMNAMAAYMKQTYPLSYDFRSNGFSVDDHKQNRIAEVTIDEQNESYSNREVMMTIRLTEAGKNHEWSQEPKPRALSKEREQQLRNALKKDGSGGSLVEFLDTVNTLEEFDEIIPILRENGKSDSLVDFYRNNLSTWIDPQLPEGFKEACPLLTARLNTPQKIRTLLRGAAFRRVTPLLMGEVLEDIIRRHEIDGEQRVVYARYQGDEWCDALRIVYHTQLQAWTLTRLALPGHTSVGVSTKDGLFVDWRSEEERKGDIW